MRHLIQHKTTKEYLADGKWTPEVREAQNFANSLSAISLTLRQHLKDVELVLMMGSEPSAQNDVHVPIGAY
jgi:hypothetical protein